jgi:hemerythrin-like domain-containing protein
MNFDHQMNRRSFTRTLATTLLGLMPLNSFSAERPNENTLGVAAVSPVEDLMREHGALNRVLLIYEEILRRLRTREEVDPTLLKQSASIIHDFIEGYHEKLEEEHLFPRLKKAGRLEDLVNTLETQHHAGRKLTEVLMNLATAGHFKIASDVKTIESAITQFINMYRPHEAREDTIVFPEFKKTLTQKEYDKLGDIFEQREQQLFGADGFELVLAKIAEIEKALGIYQLSKFNPRL